MPLHRSIPRSLTRSGSSAPRIESQIEAARAKIYARRPFPTRGL